MVGESVSVVRRSGLDSLGKSTRRGVRGLAERGRELAHRGSDAVGGPARARVILVLAAALGLQGADFGTVSANANDLERAFGVTNTGIGLLVSVSSLAAAVGTLPVGVLTDRTRRTRLLALSVMLWAVAMVFAGAATSFLWLLLARVALGVVTATAGPTIASLTGDFFPARSRARMLGYILAGELVGTGIGFVVSGEIAGLVGWRFAFWWLVIPSAVLVRVISRLPEPARGGQSRLQPGQTDIPDEREVARSASAPKDPASKDPASKDPAPRDPVQTDEEDGQQQRSAGRIAQRKQIEPQRELVLTEDPTDRSLWWAVRYVLRIRTNVVIIIASAFGYFYLSGLESFAFIYVTHHYGIPQTLASFFTLVVGIGALTGVWLGGRTADRLLARGYLGSRVLLPAVSLLGVGVVFAPGIVTTSIGVALPLLALGAALLGAANPPLDAGRLDIIHPALWGRAEGVRTMLRSLGQAAAPTLFGWVSVQVFSGRHGLEYTFLVFLVVLVIAGLLALAALRTYPRDVATAAESYRRSEQQPDQPRAAD